MDGVSEITSMIEYKLISSDTSPIFMLKDLRKMYQEKIKHLSTRFCCQDNNVKRLNETINKVQACVNEKWIICFSDTG